MAGDGIKRSGLAQAASASPSGQARTAIESSIILSAAACIPAPSGSAAPPPHPPRSRHRLRLMSSWCRSRPALSTSNHRPCCAAPSHSGRLAMACSISVSNGLRLCRKSCTERTHRVIQTNARAPPCTCLCFHLRSLAVRYHENSGQQLRLKYKTRWSCMQELLILWRWWGFGSSCGLSAA
jgi:hypothetical protein